MAKSAQAMAIELGQQAGGLAFFHRIVEHRIAGAARQIDRPGDILELVALGKQSLEPCRRLGLAGLCHIGHPLLIGEHRDVLQIHADVAVQQVAGLDQTAVAVSFQPLALQVHIGAEPEIQLALADHIPHEPFHILGGGDPGLDDGRGIGGLDHRLCGFDQHAHHVELPGGHRLQKTGGKSLCAAQPAPVGFGQLLQRLVEPGRQAVAKSRHMQG